MGAQIPRERNPNPKSVIYYIEGILPVQRTAYVRIQRTWLSTPTAKNSASSLYPYLYPPLIAPTPNVLCMTER